MELTTIATNLQLAILLGIAAIVFCASAIYAQLKVRRLRGQIPKTIATVTPQTHALLVGHVVAPPQSMIHSPYRNIRCVAFVANVTQKIKQFDPLRGFFSAKWTLVGESMRTAPFIIKDATSSICVIASRARISLSHPVSGDLDVNHTFQEVTPWLHTIAKRFAPIQSLWVSESVLVDGEAVFVSGTVQLATSLDKQLLPAQFHTAIKYVIKGTDVVISTTIPAAQIPFYEKCVRFCALTSSFCALLLFALLFL